MKALSNQIVLKMREDLEDTWGNVIRVNKATGFIEPRPVYGEVMDIGPGDPIQPDLPDLKRGDVVVWNLAKIGPPIMEHGQPLTIVSFNALLGKLIHPKTDDEQCTAILDMVLTEYAPLAMQRAISQLVELPDSIARDGMKEGPGDCPISTVFERVVSVGRGIVYVGNSKCARCKCELSQLHKPDIEKGDLVVFNPAYSVDWRRRGRNLRFTPYSEIRAKAEE